MEQKVIEQNSELDPQVYFDILKNKKQHMDDAFLNEFEQVIDKELAKAMQTEQQFVVRRLAYCKSVVEREHELVKQGIDVFVLREDIEEYIKSVEKKVVKIIELEMYPRTIPDEIVAQIAKLKEQKIFDIFYVLFTDYTGEAEKQVAQERRRKDPIIFGAFQQKLNGVWDIHDRFYFIADWEDEYCDLTLTKLVTAMSKKGKNIVNEVSIKAPTADEVRSYIHALEEKENNRFILKPKKQSFFEKIQTSTKSFIKQLTKSS